VKGAAPRAPSATSSGTVSAAAPGLLPQGSAPRPLRRKLTSACDGRLTLATFNHPAPASQTRPAAAKAISSIGHVALQVEKIGRGHPSGPLIALLLSYRRLGGAYVVFLNPPAAHRKFAAAQKNLDAAMTFTRKAAKQAGVPACAPR
jgi:hypothetical protein